ncbi:MAG: DNA methyltransferase, partial [Nitrososphaeraceae archaeon]
PMLWYYKGPQRENTIELIEDLIKSETPVKILHKWQQSLIEAEKIISRVTVENQVVLDPMMGVGTNGIAALKLKRRFVGIEKDKVRCSIARGNISEFRKPEQV